MCGLTRYGVARYQSVTLLTRIVINTLGSRDTVWGWRGGGAAWADMLLAVLLCHWAVSAVLLGNTAAAVVVGFPPVLSIHSGWQGY